MSPAHLIPVFGLARELEYVMRCNCFVYNNHQQSSNPHPSVVVHHRLVGRFCEQTEVNKESHATLLMGPHNTGKSLVRLSLLLHAPALRKKLICSTVQVLNTVLRDLEARTGNKPVGMLHGVACVCACACVRVRVLSHGG